MRKHSIKENSFDAAPGGAAGAITYQTPYGTPFGPNQTQDPDHFESDNIHKETEMSKLGITDEDLEELYSISGKTPPTPDEIISGLQYELSQQTKKNPEEAKQQVIANLRKNTKFYSELNHLNVNDKAMVDNMDIKEQSYEFRHPNDPAKRFSVNLNIEEMKKIFKDMAKEKDNKYATNPQISDVMKEMWTAKKSRKLWKP